jgi:hypothetical protein
MRDILGWFCEAVGWLGPVAVTLVAILAGCFVYIGRLAREDTSQQVLSMPTVIERIPGAVPTDLPLSVHLPAGGRIVETLVYAEKQTHVRVEAPGTSFDLLDFYERDLGTQGWRRISGASHPDQGSVLLCHTADGPLLSVFAGPPRNEALGYPLIVQIAVQTTALGHCPTEMHQAAGSERLVRK